MFLIVYLNDCEHLAYALLPIIRLGIPISTLRLVLVLYDIYYVVLLGGARGYLFDRRSRTFSCYSGGLYNKYFDVYIILYYI